MMITFQTKKNLEYMFSGESRTVRRYNIFADAAEKEGFKNLARLFRKIAKEEIRHATKHFSVLSPVRSSKESLHTAIQAEKFEQETYSTMISQCKKGIDIDAEDGFTSALRDEKEHEQLFRAALEFIKKGKDIPDSMLKK